jgi:hypothetical protein
MEKPNWVRITCGMWSSRKYSVKRHILTVHGGNSLMVSFIEYIVGRQTGIYPPPFPAAPTGYRDIKSQEPKKIASPFDIINEEYWREKTREYVRKESQRNG